VRRRGARKGPLFTFAEETHRLADDLVDRLEVSRAEPGSDEVLDLP